MKKVAKKKKTSYFEKKEKSEKTKEGLKT